MFNFKGVLLYHYHLDDFLLQFNLVNLPFQIQQDYLLSSSCPQITDDYPLQMTNLHDLLIHSIYLFFLSFCFPYSFFSSKYSSHHHHFQSFFHKDAHPFWYLLYLLDLKVFSQNLDQILSRSLLDHQFILFLF